MSKSGTAGSIYPHHTVNAERQQIASFKQSKHKKELTLIRTNVWQERSRDRPRHGLAWAGCCVREVEQGGYSDALGLWCKQDEYLACLCLCLVPNCEKIGYKLKNEDQVQSLGPMLTSLSGNFILKCLQYIHLPCPQAQKLPVYFYPLQHAPSQSISVSRILCRSTKLSCHFPASARLVLVCTTPFTFTSQTCAHKLSVNVFLSHI